VVKQTFHLPLWTHKDSIIEYISILLASHKFTHNFIKLINMGKQ
jgi:hypothetical protein